MVQSHLQRAALFLRHGKARGHGRGLLASLAQGLQGGVQLGGMGGAQQLHMGARVAQAPQDGLRHIHLRLQAVEVLRCFLLCRQQHYLRGAVGNGAEPQVHPGAGGVPQRHRDHIGRHALRQFQLGGTTQLFHQRLSALLAVQQHHGVLAARGGVSGQQGLELGALFCRTGVGIGQRARGAHGGAGATADTQVGVHLDLLTAFVAGNGFGRADVHAGIAAHGFVAAVGAKLLFVDKKLGLFELAHQLAQLQQRGHIDPITTPVPAQVTLRQRVLQEGGRGGGRTQVEHQVKALGLRRGVTGEVDGTRHLAHLHTVAVRAAGRHVDLVIEADGVLGAGRHTGVAACTQVQVNGVVGLPLQLKRTQPAGKARNAPTQHGKTPRLRTTRIAGALGEQGHIQHIRHQGGSLFGLVEGADDEQAARALVSDRGHGRWIRQAGGGQQRGDLGAGLGGIAAPATGFADVHKPDGRHRAFGLLAQIAKQALLLGASHHHIVTRLDGLLKGPRLAAAQGGVECQVFMQRRAQRLRVEGHRLVAVADERRGHVLCGWLAGPPHPYGGGRPSQARWRGR